MPSTNAIGTLLIFGGSGDLTSRLLLPGLATLLASDRNQSAHPPLVLGVGRSEIPDSTWKARVKKALASSGRTSPCFAEVVKKTRFISADITDPVHLAQLLEQCEGTPALYFALPPAITEKSCAALLGADLPRGTLIVLEKPFGTDKRSAEQLNKLLTRIVPERQIFRVDHFVGRSEVLNILGLRFANRLLDPVWSNQHIEKIELVYDEDLALEGRAGYYDTAGAMADMIQSHLLQVMATLMMEPVASLDQVSFRDAKAEVLRATVLKGTPQQASRRARYTAGTIGRRKVPRYAAEAGVDPSRETETLAEITVEVQNWRWAGVPVTLRSGKALGAPRKEVVVTLKPVPHLPKGLRGAQSNDQIIIGLKPPRFAIMMDINGPDDPFDLAAGLIESPLAEGQLTAYGEVLAGVLTGDPLLSVRGDTAVECWRIVEPVAKAWKAGKVPLDTYPAGSDGPRKWARKRG